MALILRSRQVLIEMQNIDRKPRLTGHIKTRGNCEQGRDWLAGIWAIHGGEYFTDPNLTLVCTSNWITKPCRYSCLSECMIGCPSDYHLRGFTNSGHHRWLWWTTSTTNHPLLCLTWRKYDRFRLELVNCSDCVQESIAVCCVCDSKTHHTQSNVSSSRPTFKDIESLPAY